MTKRLTITIHEDIHNDILKIANKDERTVNYIINSLLSKSLKEKKRIRNGKKEIHTANNASN